MGGAYSLREGFDLGRDDCELRFEHFSFVYVIFENVKFCEEEIPFDDEIHEALPAGREHFNFSFSEGTCSVFEEGDGSGMEGRFARLGA